MLPPRFGVRVLSLGLSHLKGPAVKVEGFRAFYGLWLRALGLSGFGACRGLSEIRKFARITC